MWAVVPPHRGSRKRRTRPGLVDLYLIRGVAGPFLLILVAVCVAMMLERALRLVQEMAVSGADLGYFPPLLAQFLPYYLDLGLPAAFMVALDPAHRTARRPARAGSDDGERTVDVAHRRALLALGLAVGLAGLVTGGWIEPHGRYNFRTLHSEALNASQIGRLQPRAFYHPAESLAVTFDRRAADASIGGIFVWQLLADGREQIITSRSGRIGFVPRARLFGIEMDPASMSRSGRAQPAHRPIWSRSILLAFREALQLRDLHWRRGWDQNEMTLPELGAVLGTGTGTISRRAIEAEFYSRISRAAILPFAAAAGAAARLRHQEGATRPRHPVVRSDSRRDPSRPQLRSKPRSGGVVDPRASILGATTLCAVITLLVFLSGRHLPSHSPISGVLKPIGERLARFTPASRHCPACVAERSPPISPGNWENGL